MIHVTPLSRLDETLRGSGARSLLTLLSPGADFTPPADRTDLRWLGIWMHDIAEPRDGLVAPTEKHVASILDFGRAWDRQSPLVVHCYAGISRSTAAAYIIAAALQPERNEFDLAQELRLRSPSATPNPLIVAHADRLLQRRGRMVEATHAIGQGTESFEGLPFFIALR